MKKSSLPEPLSFRQQVNVSDIQKVIEPVFQAVDDNLIYYIDFSEDEFHLGGSSFAQVRNRIGSVSPTVKDAAYFKKCFNTVQKLINKDLITGRA